MAPALATDQVEFEQDKTTCFKSSRSVVNIKGWNGGKFTVDLKALKCSSVLTEMLDLMETMDSHSTSDVSNVFLHLPHINYIVLRKVLRWAQHHRNHVHPSTSKDSEAFLMDKWDIKFFKLEPFTVIRQILAAAETLNMYGLIKQTKYLLDLE